MATKQRLWKQRQRQARIKRQKHRERLAAALARRQAAGGAGRQRGKPALDYQVAQRLAGRGIGVR